MKNFARFFVFNLLCIFLSLYSLEASVIKKKVYVYPKTGNIPFYNNWSRKGFEEIFKEFEVIPVSSLKNLRDFEYIATEQVPFDDKELEYLSHYPREKVLLFIFETLLLHPRDHNKFYHSYYSNIFTWNDDFVDNKTYFRILAPWNSNWYQISDLSEFEDRKLSVFVGNLHGLRHPCANYSERVRVIDFFEQQAGEDFDFYGTHLPGRTHYKNYKGAIEGGPEPVGFIHKVHVLKNYKFDFCYENTKNVNGFISERIYQSLSAGCIPIYSGAKNIGKYIPKNCFIALNDFDSYEDLYSFIKNMSKEDYEIYRKNIREFLASEAAYRTSTDYYIYQARRVLGLE